jgi:type I restriction enzyme M protein
MVNNHYEIEKYLWASAYNFLAKSMPKSSGYFVPGLGLIFLHYAGHKFAHAEKEPLLEATP